MKMTQRETKRNLSKAEKWIVTAYTLSRTIPGCESLDIYKLDWHDYDNDESIPIIKNQIKECVEKWLSISNELNIIQKLIQIKSEQLSAFLKLKKLVDDKFKIYFMMVPNGLPAKIVRPLSTFFPVSKNIGESVQLDKPIIRECDSTKIIIRGTVLHARDFKTIYVLMKLMLEAKVECFEDEILYFETSFTQIGKELRLKNPYAEKTRDGILNSLSRLRRCTIVWKWKNKNNRKHFKIGGILAKAKSLEETSSGEIGLFIDMDFLRLYQYGYLDIDEDKLYRLTSDRAILMYLYLVGQKEFNQYSKLGPVNIFDIYYNANLEGIGQPKEASTKRFELIKCLESLKSHNVIGDFDIQKNKLKIFNKKRRVE